MKNEIFELLWELKEKQWWWNLEIYATTTKDIDFASEWNGKHPVEENSTLKFYPTGTRVRVWMVSRFGDVGVTDNIIDPRGYTARVNPDEYLKDFEFKVVRNESGFKEFLENFEEMPKDIANVLNERFLEMFK